MTLIVGIIGKDGNVYMGSDSLGSSTYSGSQYETKKCFRSEDSKHIIMGATASYRHIDLLKFNKLFDDDAITLFENNLKTFDAKYIVNKFIPKVKKYSKITILIKKMNLLFY